MTNTSHLPMADTDLSGRQLGDFQLLRRLGHGAMADVYLAEQQSLRRQIAFKILKNELAGDQTYVKRFLLEAQAAASLVHASIVQIHDVGCIDGVHFIAQEYVHGLNLREYITRNGPLDTQLAAHVMRQVAAALQRASEQGIVHRDIKPENIMLAKTGEVKVADFGLARMLRDPVSTDLTQVGMTMGTPLYMSPEQVEGRPLDSRSDIYSFGVTCYFMLSGEPPFRGDTALSVALQHLKNQPVRLETVRKDLDPRICRIVHQMLAKDPDERFRSAREMLKELRNLKIDGHEDHDDSLDWSPEETIGSLRFDATQQLATIMSDESRGKLIPRRLGALILSGGLLAFLLGGTAAYLARPANMLAGIDLSFVRFETAEQQFNYAAMFPSVEAWQAVLDYYGDHKRYAPMAKQELALMHLLDGHSEQALPLFQDLSNNVVPRYAAYGLAGQAVTYDLEGNREASNQKLQQLFQLTGVEQSSGTEPFTALFGRQPTPAESHLMRGVATLLTKSNQEIGQAYQQRLATWLEGLNSDTDDNGTL